MQVQFKRDPVLSGKIMHFNHLLYLRSILENLKTQRYSNIHMNKFKALSFL